MAISRKQEIDGVALRAEIARRKMRMQDVDRMIGRAFGFTSGITNANAADQATIIALDKIVGIPFEEYAPVKKKPVGGVALTKEELYQIIYSATLDALLKARSTPRQ